MTGLVKWGPRRPLHTSIRRLLGEVVVVGLASFVFGMAIVFLAYCYGWLVERGWL